MEQLHEGPVFPIGTKGEQNKKIKDFLASKHS
jgi:hypothetical protein